MPVVINDVDVMPEAGGARGPGSGGAAAESANEKTKLDAAELQKALNAQRERELRVWAH